MERKRCVFKISEKATATITENKLNLEKKNK